MGDEQRPLSRARSSTSATGCPSSSRRPPGAGRCRSSSAATTPSRSARWWAWRKVRGAGGVVWIDAHGDLNTPATSPTGNVHGMVLAAALGLAGDSFRRDGWPLPAVEPGKLALVGVRSLDDGERELAARARREGLHDERDRPDRDRAVHAGGARARGRRRLPPRLARHGRRRSRLRARRRHAGAGRALVPRGAPRDGDGGGVRAASTRWTSSRSTRSSTARTRRGSSQSSSWPRRSARASSSARARGSRRRHRRRWRPTRSRTRRTTGSGWAPAWRVRSSGPAATRSSGRRWRSAADPARDRRRDDRGPAAGALGDPRRRDGTGPADGCRSRSAHDALLSRARRRARLPLARAARLRDGSRRLPACRVRVDHGRGGADLRGRGRSSA